MGFRKGAYATIWEVKPISDKLVKARVSISRKNKETNTYEAEFEDYIVFSGSVAAKNAMGLHEKDRIQIGDCDVRNKYDHEKKVKYYNFMIFSFDIVNGGATIPAVDDTSPQPDVDSGEIDDSRLPF